MSSATHIAVVDDEADITALIGNYLAGHGYRVSQLPSGEALFNLMDSDPVSLILLDLGLPGEDGLAIAREIRERGHVGLVILTGRGDAVDKIVGLELGADDYVTKPFDLRELLARIKAVLRRTEAARRATGSAAPKGPNGANTLIFEDWKIDLDARRLIDPKGCEVSLTSGEFDLLAAFAQHRGRVLSRDFLLEHTRGREAGPYERTIDVQVSRLRKKLEADPENPRILKSVRGVGYIFVPNVTSVSGGR